MVNPLFLLDTNALSEPLKPVPHAGFMSRLHQHRDVLALCSTTWHAALFGLHRLPAGKRRQQVEEYLLGTIAAALPILPYDEGAAAWHGRERARLVARGLPPPFADSQIAAVAVRHQLTLVTHNVTDFANFQELSVQDWFV